MQIQYINNLRAVACFLVILTHAAMPAVSDSHGMYMVLFSLIASPSSELFVTISSSLLAPTKLEMFDFYKKRFKKLLPPFIFWSLFTLIFNLLLNRKTLEETFFNLLLFPIKPVAGVYWFIYTISGLYFLIPIISPWLKKASKKELQFIILLWFITLCLPYLNLLFHKEIYTLNGNYYFILSYFGGFIGFMLLGVYLRKFPFIIKNKLLKAPIIIAIFIVGTIPIAYGYLFNRGVLKILNDNLSLTSFVYVFGIFTFFQNVQLPVFVENIFNNIAKYSYGIYLMHIIIARDVVWKIFENFRLHPIIETPLIAIITTIICFIIVKTISKLPNSKYIVGA